MRRHSERREEKGREEKRRGEERRGERERAKYPFFGRNPDFWPNTSFWVEGFYRMDLVLVPLPSDPLRISKGFRRTHITSQKLDFLLLMMMMIILIDISMMMIIFDMRSAQ